ncbi:hypothetical protein Pelo_14801 [Pelomyxa schiedti]|nr:hypothetical protein Pelo_14801 [Pelomyxa schiedti]
MASKCPLCDEEIEGKTKPLTAKGMLAKLAAIEVHCPVCSANVKRDLLDEHIFRCPVECPRKCGVRVSPENQTVHEQTECPNVVVTCASCSEAVQRRAIKDLSHKQLDCPIPCQNGCGQKVRPRDMNQHNSTTCTSTNIKCSAPQFCAWTGPRCDLDSHLRSCILVKVTPVLNSLVEDNSRMRSALSKLEESNRQKEDTLRQIEENHNHRVRTFHSEMEALKDTMKKSEALHIQSVEALQQLRAKYNQLEANNHQLEADYKQKVTELIRTQQQSEEKHTQKLSQLSSHIEGLYNQRAIIPSLLPNPPECIMMNAPISVLQGWNVHYKQPYPHITQPSHIDPGKGDWILVASQQIGRDVLSLAAVGRRTDVCRRTTSREVAVGHRGAYWYFVEGVAFGFAPTSRVCLSFSDCCGDDGDRRLSWLLNGAGGWRSGPNTLVSDNSWLKLICWA